MHGLASDDTDISSIQLSKKFQTFLVIINNFVVAVLQMARTKVQSIFEFLQHMQKFTQE